MTNGTVSQSWADKVEREQEGYTDVDEEAGLKHVVEYEERDGKRVKVTKTYRLVKQNVPKGVLTRRSWKKFGDAERGEPCTTEFQDVRMEFVTGASAGGHDEHDEDNADMGGGVVDSIGQQTQVIKCQYCKGPHYSVKCPLKSLVSDIEKMAGKGPATAGAGAAAAAPAGTPGAYVPPGARSGALRSGASAIGNFSSRDDLPTLRISNLTDNATEDDLRELVQQMDLAHIKRIHIPKDFDKKRSRGFAYISFDSHFEAEKCLRVLNGMKYDHLVLHVEWAKK